MRCRQKDRVTLVLLSIAALQVAKCAPDPDCTLTATCEPAPSPDADTEDTASKQSDAGESSSDGALVDDVVTGDALDASGNQPVVPEADGDSSGTEDSRDGNSGDSADKDGSTSAPDAGSESSTEAEAGNDIAQLTCGVQPAGDEVGITMTSSPVPTVFTGGPIADGTYVLVNVTRYASTGTDPTLERRTIVFRGDKYYDAQTIANDPNLYASLGTFSVLGSVLARTGTVCDLSGAQRFQEPIPRRKRASTSLSLATC
jgi:hypothetical protein